jgi:hypothetical protein
MGFTNDIIGGAAALIRAAIRSPNYVAGVSGWSINKDGSAEFNNMTIRGVFNGTDFIINSTGEFFYSGTPANGNLLVAIASVAGVDSFGNSYHAGIDTFSGGAEVLLNAGFLGLFDTSGHEWGIGAILAAGVPYLTIFTPGAGNGQMWLDEAAAWHANNPAIAATPETWHSLGSFGAASWTINQGRYQLTSEGECEIDIALNAQVGGGAAGTFTWTNTLPAAYQFAGNYSRSYPLAYNGTIAAGQNYGVILVDGAGTPNPGRVRIQLAALPATTNVGNTARIPLS